MQFLVEISC